GLPGTLAGRVSPEVGGRQDDRLASRGRSGSSGPAWKRHGSCLPSTRSCAGRMSRWRASGRASRSGWGHGRSGKGQWKSDPILDRKRCKEGQIAMREATSRRRFMREGSIAAAALTGLAGSVEAKEGAAYLCVTCGTQFPESAKPPEHCPICEDERQ